MHYQSDLVCYYHNQILPMNNFRMLHTLKMWRLCVVLLALCGPAWSQVVVDTQYGQVEGHVVPVNNGREQTSVVSFLGIPFAADTSGPRRFMRAVPPDPWADVFVADTLGDVCAAGQGIMPLTHANWTRFSEDCLNVNIYTPDVSGNYPVMVWIYGGGYTSGANIQYPGHFLASYGVVVVALNYRLGAFGFSYTGDAASPGNVGLWDQNMGLQFVVDNIANFGGDPTQITLFGESAGAASTSLQLLSPRSKDLFQQAIMESGAETNFWVYHPPETYPANYTTQVATSLGCSTDDSSQMMDCLRTLSWENIVFNGTFDCAEGYLCLGLGPVIDDPATGILPDRPDNLRASGDIMRGPIITGLNHDDGSIFLPVFVPGVLVGCCNRTYYQRLLRERFPDIMAPFESEQTKYDLYVSFDFYYSPWPYLYDNYRNRDSLARLVTDVGFGYHTDRQLKSHAEISSAYGYVYNYRGRNMTQFLPEWLGIPHFAELPYVWGYTLLPFNEEVLQDSGFNVELVHWTDEDVDHTIFMQEMFTNFAKFGNPTPSPVPNPLGGTTVWPSIRSDSMKSLVISNVSIEATEFRARDYVFWEDYTQYIMDGSIDTKIPQVSLEPISGDYIMSYIEQYATAAAEGSLLEFLDEWGIDNMF